MSLDVRSEGFLKESEPRLEFARYRIQGVFETHGRKPETIANVVSDYINVVHAVQPDHIFDPIQYNDTAGVAKGITDELERVITPMNFKVVLPHSGEVYGIFVDYLTDDHAKALREEIGVSSIPRAITMTLAHFILGELT